MSFWLYTRDKGGKWHLWGIDFDPMTVVALIALMAAMFVPISLRNLSIAAFLPPVLVLSGLACLIAAKVSLFRRGIWFSFGSGLMSKGCTDLYKAAYFLIGLGVLLMFLLLAVLRGLG